MSKFMISTVVVIVIAALIIVAFSLQVRTNKLLEENENLKDELSDIEYTNEQLEKELDKEIDDEYIKKAAEDELGLIPPDSKVYYSDLPN